VVRRRPIFLHGNGKKLVHLGEYSILKMSRGSSYIVKGFPVRCELKLLAGYLENAKQQRFKVY